MWISSPSCGQFMFGDRCTCLLFVSCWFQQYCTHSCFSATYKAEEDLPTVVDRYTCRTPHFDMYSHCTDHSTDDMCSGLKELAGLKFELRHQKSLHPRVMFLHCSEPGGRRPKYGRNSMQLGQAKARSTQKYLETSSKHSALVQFRAPSERGLQFYQTRSHAIILYNTQFAICVERGACMKTNEEFILQSMSAYKLSSCYAETEFAKWTTGST